MPIIVRVGQVNFVDGDVEEREPAGHILFQTFTVSIRHRTPLPEFVVPLFRYDRNQGHAWAPGDRNSRTQAARVAAYRARCSDAGNCALRGEP